LPFVFPFTEISEQKEKLFTGNLNVIFCKVLGRKQNQLKAIGVRSFNKANDGGSWAVDDRKESSERAVK
jgi:hypothetical protein